MSVYTKTAGALLVLAAACWMVLICFSPTTGAIPLALAAAALSIACICFFAVGVSRRLRKGCSPYLVFALADGLVGLCVLCYAFYDIHTSTGWFGGLAGALLLIAVLPIVVIFLLAELLVWCVQKYKRRKK